MKSAHALITTVGAPDNETVCGELVEQTDQAGPFDVKLIGQLALAHAVIVADAYKRGGECPRKSKACQFPVERAAHALLERPKARQEGSLELGASR